MFNKKAFFAMWHRINAGAALFRMVNRLSLSKTYWIATLMLIGLAIADYLTHVELTLSPWYTFPCFLVDWRIGRMQALAYAVFATALQLLIGMTGTHDYPNMVYLIVDLILNLGFCVVLIWIIAKLRLALEMEIILSRSDFLTKLANRQSLLEGLEIEIKRCRRQGTSLVAVMIDLDNFKRFNDKRGHSVGDLVLSAVAELLREKFRSTDIIARTDDDEFMLLLPAMNAEVTEAKLHSLRKNMENLMMERGWEITSSLAAMVFVNPSVSSQQVIQEVQQLMREIKQREKNGFVMHVLSIKNTEDALPPQLEKQAC